MIEDVPLGQRRECLWEIYIALFVTDLLYSRECAVLKQIATKIEHSIYLKSRNMKKYYENVSLILQRIDKGNFRDTVELEPRVDVFNVFERHENMHDRMCYEYGEKSMEPRHHLGQGRCCCLLRKGSSDSMKRTYAEDASGSPFRFRGSDFRGASINSLIPAGPGCDDGIKGVYRHTRKSSVSGCKRCCGEEVPPSQEKGKAFGREHRAFRKVEPVLRDSVGMSSSPCTRSAERTPFLSARNKRGGGGFENAGCVESGSPEYFPTFFAPPQKPKHANVHEDPAPERKYRSSPYVSRGSRPFRFRICDGRPKIAAAPVAEPGNQKGSAQTGEAVGDQRCKRSVTKSTSRAGSDGSDSDQVGFGSEECEHAAHPGAPDSVSDWSCTKPIKLPYSSTCEIKRMCSEFSDEFARIEENVKRRLLPVGDGSAGKDIWDQICLIRTQIDSIVTERYYTTPGKLRSAIESVRRFRSESQADRVDVKDENSGLTDIGEVIRSVEKILEGEGDGDGNRIIKLNTDDLF